MDHQPDWFERIWEHREEVLYPAYFGTEREGIFTIPIERLRIGGLSDPRWMTCGAFRFAPTPTRDSWLCVSSGLSNDWFAESPDAEAVSGFGCEFVIESRTKCDWAIQRLHQLMTYQIALSVGKYPEHEPLNWGHRVPCGGPIDFKESRLTIALLVPPEGFDVEFEQESGYASFLQVVGISEPERDYAKNAGNEQLINWLRCHTAYPVTDPTRRTLEDAT